MRIADYQIIAVKGEFKIGNKEFDGKFKFDIYRDNKTPFFESGYLYDTAKDALHAALKFHFRDLTEWIIEEYSDSVLLWYKNKN